MHARGLLLLVQDKMLCRTADSLSTTRNDLPKDLHATPNKGVSRNLVGKSINIGDTE